jgi:carbon storage regulator
MLVLGRKTGECIIIGENIELTVLGIRGGRVRLGVAAPMNVPVHRLEVLERLRREDELENSQPQCWRDRG